MNVAASTSLPGDAAVDLLGIIAFDDDVPTLDDAFHGPPRLLARLREAFADERFQGSQGQTVVIHTDGLIPARRVAVVGAGARAHFRPADARHPAAVLARIGNKVGARSMSIAFRGTDRGSAELASLESLAQGACLGSYRFTPYLAADKHRPSTLASVSLQIDAQIGADVAASAIAKGVRVADAIGWARDLVNEPAAALTPVTLATAATKRATETGLGVTILGPEECRARGMGLFLAVAQGSAEEPRFVHLAFKPTGAKARVVLVGKGVTFDSGGLSLKTTEGMLDMKSDMAGAAAVLAAIGVAAAENLPVEVHALAACTENMPSGKSYKLGDVLRSMAGKSVEINNTDAEGRLTLADAITYGLALKPDVVIDVATLTGACVVALGPHTAGAMTNDEPTLTGWLAAARAAGEDIWPLPLPPRLIDQLKSEIADLRNTGERWGGALTAGLFLKEFVGSTPWIHLDIAGPATTDKEWGCFCKGATGFGVASIVEYLRQLAKV
ncbi:MAG: leucyl aminopeptidase [Pseudomonadota bacterium]